MQAARSSWRGQNALPRYTPVHPITLPLAHRRRKHAAATASDRDQGNALAPPKEAVRARYNEIGVQQLSSQLHPQLFSGPIQRPPDSLVQLSKDHLSRHELLGKNQEQPAPIALDLPPLFGHSLDEHFYRLGRSAAEPYLSKAVKFALTVLPQKPQKWQLRSGWTKYQDGEWSAVDAPNEDMLTFDTEVMWKESQYAVMACAVSPTAWYSWLSPWLLGESENDKHLIPLGDPSKERIVVGHNIGYDRARVAEEYSIQQSKNFFLDTMSLHVAVNGMCSRQRPTWMKHKKNRDAREKIASETNSHELNTLLENRLLSEEEEELWVGRSSINSLRDVAKFHCNVTIDKADRDLFGELSRQDLRKRLDQLLDYCAAEVSITHRVYQKVFPGFVETCPHPVSFAALRHLSSVILPIDKSWEAYTDNAEAVYRQLTAEVEQRLHGLAKSAVEYKDQPEKYINDPWLGQLDWTIKPIKMVKGKKGSLPQPSARQKQPGMPQWWKDLFASRDSDMTLTVRTRVAPILLRLAWDGYPLVWSNKYGWTFAVPVNESAKYSSNTASCDMSKEPAQSLREDNRHRYFRLPHKDGPEARCTNPMAKGYLQYFNSGTLSSEYAYAKEALEMNASCSYWVSSRDRIRTQMSVFEGEAVGTSQASSSQGRGYILPQVVPMGTITRRAVENTWLTASNAKSNRVGSELKSMIKAPNGYSFVGADVDSQELWIASLLGDAQFQLHGGNAIGFMTLEGTKAAGTDLHSKTAKILGISRNDAKVFNYGRIYGAGLRFAQTLLRQFNPSLTEEKAQEIAARLYQETKGVKTRKRHVLPRPFWRGGTESFVFNTLESFAEHEQPRTPALGAGITEALRSRYINKGSFMTSRINWAIQSSGVDYLHLLIVSMDYLISRFDLNARLALTVHDEIRYLVKNEDRYKAAMALQVANIWTRAMFAQQVGIHELPQSCAFFSAIDIDHVLRKEVDMDCITPSHPTGIPPGESLDIWQLMGKGHESHLDPAVLGQGHEEPMQWKYTPRTPVMTEMRNTEAAPTMGMLKAQITSDDQELKNIVKEMTQAKAALETAQRKKARRNIVQSHSYRAAPPQELQLPDFDYSLLNTLSHPATGRAQWIARPEASTRHRGKQTVTTV